MGRNGQGKTNLVEAIDYLSRLSSHRVAADAPLVRPGAEQAVVRAAVVRDERRAVLEIEINPGRSNRARVNQSPLPRARELLGLVRTVVFSPEDLALVKGDPSERRRFADDLLVAAPPALRRGPRRLRPGAEATQLPAEDAPVPPAVGRGVGRGVGAVARWASGTPTSPARRGDHRRPDAAGRGPHVRWSAKAYEAVARGATRDDAALIYRPSFLRQPDDRRPGPARRWPRRCWPSSSAAATTSSTAGSAWSARTATTSCSRLGDLPVKGYASHGESWSFALALRLASYDLLRDDGDDPVLILDDVFAELDTGRRAQLADLVADAEQVLVTAAVAEDIPDAAARPPLHGRRRRGAPAMRTSRSRPGPRAAIRATRRATDDDGLDLARSIARGLAGRTGSPAGPAAPQDAGSSRPGAASPTGLSGATPTTATRRRSTRTLGRLVADQGWATDLRVHGVFTRWSAIVGREVAEHCTPESYAEGRLVVRTDSTAWATQMTLLAGRVVTPAQRGARRRHGRVIDVLGPHVPRWTQGPAPGQGPRPARHLRLSRPAAGVRSAEPSAAVPWDSTPTPERRLRTAVPGPLWAFQRRSPVSAGTDRDLRPLTGRLERQVVPARGRHCRG